MDLVIWFPVSNKAFWFPISNMSIVDLICYLEKDAKYVGIRKVVKQTWEGHLKGIVCYTEVDAVFCDFNNDTHSSTFDAAAAVIAHNDHIVKFTSLCGNDFSYINKVTDIMGYMISKE